MKTGSWRCGPSLAMLAEPNAFDRGGQGEHQDPLSGGGDERLEAHGSFKKTGSWRREPRMDMQVEEHPLHGGGQGEQEDPLGGGGDERLEAAGTSTKREPRLE